MARRLEAALRDLPPVQIVHPCQTNGVFVSMPPALMQGLRQRGWEFHDTPDSCRLMCSWDTTEEDVDALANDAKSLVKSMSNI
jgi:threonine aldolase